MTLYISLKVLITITSGTLSQRALQPQIHPTGPPPSLVLVLVLGVAAVGDSVGAVGDSVGSVGDDVGSVGDSVGKLAVDSHNRRLVAVVAVDSYNRRLVAVDSYNRRLVAVVAVVGIVASIVVDIRMMETSHFVGTPIGCGL